MKLIVAMLCAFAFTPTHAQYGKLWWNPNQNGMGTPIEQQRSVSVTGVMQEVIFGVWFHYTLIYIDLSNVADLVGDS